MFSSFFSYHINFYKEIDNKNNKNVVRSNSYHSADADADADRFMIYIDQRFRTKSLYVHLFKLNRKDASIYLDVWYKSSNRSYIFV